MRLTRRHLLQAAAVAALPGVPCPLARAVEDSGFQLRYLLASCLYGYAPLHEILPEVARSGSAALDIWPKVHGNQRDQLDQMGEEAFAALLAEHNVTLGCITQYALGPLKLQNEMHLAARLGCATIVTGAVGPKDLTGPELKQAVAQFVDKLKPHIEVAEQTGVTLAIENHAHNLIESPDAIRWLADMSPSARLKIALAPFHLPQDAKLLGDLIRQLGDRLHVFYAWQHGLGSTKKLPKEEELLQLPGRGPLDFGPLVRALRDINYRGWTEVFMHPVPRGVPMLPTPQEITAEVNRARQYLTTGG